MKNVFTLPILSGIALAIMAGATASHYAAVDNMIAIAGMTRANGLPSTSPGPALLVGNKGNARSVVDELKRQNDSLQRTLASNEAAISALPRTDGQSVLTGNEGDLKHLLSELVNQNSYLRNQIAETNRDLMTLQFQVDTHSNEFRPLSVNEIDTGYGDMPEIDTSIGVLPPTDLP